MSKYEPLESYLASRTTQEVPMTFEEIERIIRAKLPPAAHAHRAWWSNNPSNNVMTKSWLAAGFESERVFLGSEKFDIRRSGRPGRPLNTPKLPATPPRQPDGDGPPKSGGVLNRLWASLRGTVHVPEGVDLTAPTGEVWDAEK